MACYKRTRLWCVSLQLTDEQRAERAAAVAAGRGAWRDRVPPGVDLVAELIAERRWAAKAENEACDSVSTTPGR
jgi:hypothetical protein